MSRWKMFGVLVCGGILGVGASVAAEEVNRITSTDEFCATSCHSMQAYIADDPVYLESAHRTSATWVVAGCADCHLPRGLLRETWAHIEGGVKDLIAESRYDFSDPAVWEARRTALMSVGLIR